jgi:hypothetical protein
VQVTREEIVKSLSETAADTEQAVATAWYVMKSAHLAVAVRVDKLRKLVTDLEEGATFGSIQRHERDLAKAELGGYEKTLAKLSAYMGLE